MQGMFLRRVARLAGAPPRTVCSAWQQPAGRSAADCRKAKRPRAQKGTGALGKPAAREPSAVPRCKPKAVSKLIRNLKRRPRKKIQMGRSFIFQVTFERASCKILKLKEALMQTAFELDLPPGVQVMVQGLSAALRIPCGHAQTRAHHRRLRVAGGRKVAATPVSPLQSSQARRLRARQERARGSVG